MHPSQNFLMRGPHTTEVGSSSVLFASHVHGSILSHKSPILMVDISRVIENNAQNAGALSIRTLALIR